jgi:hypothetical protein
MKLRRGHHQQKLDDANQAVTHEGSVDDVTTYLEGLCAIALPGGWLVVQ